MPSSEVSLLCKTLGELTQLEKLDLLGNLINNEVLASISQLTQLSSLNLSESIGQSYSPAALRSTVDALPGLCKLSLGSPEAWTSLSVGSLLRIATQPNPSFPSPCASLTSRTRAVQALLSLLESQPFASFAHNLEASPVPVSRLCPLLVSGFWGYDPKCPSAILALQRDITQLLWELSKKDFCGRGGIWDGFHRHHSALYCLFLVLSDPEVNPESCMQRSPPKGSELT